MKATIFSAIAALLLFACNSNKENSKTAAQLDEYLTAQSTHYRFNGNVLVAENGKIVFQKSYGYANFDTQRMLNDSTVFELASVSKQFTATAILLLKDKGKLKLTDSLRQYFPELPYSGISLYQMLTHTSGLPDYEEAMNEKWDHSKIAFNNDMIAFLAKEKLPVLFAPGTKWTYSNTAYAILASIAEKVSGQPFSEYMAQNIFKPLQMNHTRIYNTRRSLKDSIANYAYGFEYNDSLKKYFMPDSVNELKFVIYLDGIQGDGVVNSTTADLLKWDRAIKNNTLLNQATQKEMLKEHAIVDTVKKLYYGFGVFTEKTELGNIISHSGGWPGYTTYLARNVDKDQTFIVLSNNSSPSPTITTALQHILNGKPVAVAYQHKAITMDSLALQQFVGKYKATDEIRIERYGNKLFRVNPNGQKMELKPESATKFFYADGSDRQVEFEMDADPQDAVHKKITKAWMINYGVRIPLEKI
ncbi:serine hydrolase domain-containing protein [Ferruginibacter sp.]|nr:serine hydrolase [Ferruginibacter sp.]